MSDGQFEGEQVDDKPASDLNKDSTTDTAKKRVNDDNSQSSSSGIK